LEEDMRLFEYQALSNVAFCLMALNEKDKNIWRKFVLSVSN
jgi:hypothetical protein